MGRGDRAGGRNGFQVAVIDGEAPFWLINILGAIGFSAYLLSPLLPSRRALLITDAAAMLPIAMHYVLLGGIMGAVMSVVYLLADIIGLGADRHRPLLWVLAALAIGLCAWFYGGAADLAALAGTLSFLVSRHVKQHWKTLLIAGISTVVWAYYGYVAGSISQQIFSAIYIVAVVFRLYRLRQS